MNALKHLSFHNVQFDVVDRQGQPWLRGLQIASALGFKNPSSDITNLYDRNADEFTDAMTALVKVPDLHLQTASAGQMREVRIFSLRGCHLLAMLARTDVAKAFRKWVLDLIDHGHQPDTDPAIEASRLFREIGPSLRAVGIRGEKLAKGTNQVVQRLTGVDLLGMAGVDSAAPSVPDPFDLQLLACWHEVLGEQVLTAREAIQKAQGTALESFLRMVATDRKTPGTISSVRLGRWLQRTKNCYIDPWRLDVRLDAYLNMRTWCVSNATQPQYLLQ